MLLLCYFFFTCFRYVHLILSSYNVKSFRRLELGIEIIFVQCLVRALEVIFEKDSDYNKVYLPVHLAIQFLEG